MIIIDPFGMPAVPQPEAEVLIENVSGGLVGSLPMPGDSTSSQGDGSVDCSMFINAVTPTPDVEGSYSVNFNQAFSGPTIENYGPAGAGYCLPDQSLGVARNGYRGMADEPLPVRPPKPDVDDDYDNTQY